MGKTITRDWNVIGISQSKINTTAYHPQSNGLVEMFNRTLIDMLTKTAELNGNNWDEKLPYVLFAYRSTMQESTGQLPFQLLAPS